MDSDEAAAGRAGSAGRRTREITQRLTRLAEDRGSGVADVRTARQHAEEAQERADESLRRAVAGHERAARSHERAADVHERAALLGVGDVGEHRRRAESHRRDARADLEEASSDRARAERTDRRTDEEGPAPAGPTP